jgi:hypothetical protein
MLRSAMAYLAAADATAMAAEEQARCLRVMEQVTAVGTAARISVLSAFTAGQGYSADADYSPRGCMSGPGLICPMRTRRGRSGTAAFGSKPRSKAPVS